MRHSLEVSISAIVLAAGLALDTQASLLGTAGDFNAFIFGDMQYMNSDAEGRVAVGGNVNYMNMGIGSQLPNSNGTRDDLIVGGNIDWTNGQVFSGNARYGGTASFNSVGFPNGSAFQAAPPFDFNEQRGYLESAAMSWGSLDATGTSTNNFGSITLSGASSGVNVFSLSAAELATANGLTINVPTGATTLVNISGNAASMQNFGFFLNGATNNTVLYNFYEAQTLDMSSIGVRGSVLAPFADISFNNGQLDGTLIGASLIGTGELHHHSFTGDLPPIPAPNVLACFGLLALGGRRRRSPIRTAS